MTRAQAMLSALEMRSLEATDLYILSEDLLDIAEGEKLRSDIRSWNAACLAIRKARWGA